MKKSLLIPYLQDAAVLLQKTAGSPAPARMETAITVTVAALRGKHPLLVCGNGGSAADSMHISGELVGKFFKERKALKCICLSSNPVVLTAWSNDFSFDTVFSRQVEAYGERGGVLVGLSTSGNSKNILEAFRQARKMGMKTIGFTGEGGGLMGGLSDILIDVPSRSTPSIQQVHTHLYHYFCQEIESRIFGNKNSL